MLAQINSFGIRKVMIEGLGKIVVLMLCGLVFLCFNIGCLIMINAVGGCKSNIESFMKGMMACFIAVIFWGGLASAWAIEPPTDEQLRGGLGATYFSTRLSMDPCLDVQESGFVVDDDLIREVESARRRFPPNACQDESFVILVRRLHFYQLNGLALTKDPLNYYSKIKIANRSLGRCTNVACASRILESEVRSFRSSWMRIADLNEVQAKPDFVIFDMRPAKMHEIKLVRRYVDQLRGNEYCGLKGRVSYGVRRHGFGNVENMIIICVMDPGQIDFPLWIVRLDPKSPKLLLAESQGGNCFALAVKHQGYPDLHCSYKVSAGEHPTTIYSYFRGAYRKSLNYTLMAGNEGWLVAADLDR